MAFKETVIVRPNLYLLFGAASEFRVRFHVSK